MRKKIVIIVESMLGGIRQHVCDIIENLNINQFEIWLIYSDLRADQAFYTVLPMLEERARLIQCNEMKRSIGKNDIYAYKKICKYIKEIKPDIVHCHSSKAGIVGRLAAKKCKVEKIYYTPNAYAFQSPEISMLKRYIYIFAERFLSRCATTKTINVSRGEQLLAIDYHIDRTDKFILIYNGIKKISLETKYDIRKRLGYSLERFLVGVTARCAEQKDPITWLKIAKRVIDIRNDIDFIYIGDGPLKEEMENWVKSRQLEDRIKILGFRTDASQIVGMFDIYLSTALYEGLPYSMIEAMRAGIPIIATDVVGNNELVMEGVNGRLFNNQNIEEGSKYIIEQLTKKIVNKDMVLGLFEDKFSVKTMIDKVEDLFWGRV